MSSLIMAGYWGGWLAKLQDLTPLRVLIHEHFGFGRRAARRKAIFPFSLPIFPLPAPLPYSSGASRAS